jgi:hypothetical protein
MPVSKRSKKPKSRMPTPATPAPNEVPPSDALIFEVEWSDGTKTRMSVHTFADSLDVKRGVAVSRAAYSSRKKIPMSSITATIVQGHFEDSSGAIVATYNAAQIKKEAA